MLKNKKIFLAGHNGHVGTAILKKLKYLGYKKIIVADRKKLDLTNQSQVFKFIKKTKPFFIIIAAARVGGILANNSYRAEFIYENLTMQNNLIHGSHINGVKNLIFLGSSCIYPKFCKQPQKESYLLNGKLEYTNEPYALAKIAGVKMCENYNLQYKTNYLSLMPTNSYGFGDSYDLNKSHFFPALIKKIFLAKMNNKKSVTLLGTGKAKRELIFVDDIADAVIYFMNKKTKENLINIGTGKEMSIEQYAKFILDKLNLKIKIKFDNRYPDGTPRKILDTSLAKKNGWVAKTDLETGFNKTYQEFIEKKLYI
jgi:GDP-L-fucose synthase|tara:strand:+ start:838 stop:1773 length:936 start_codon:yes stop_codon:yes gene_type:complete